MNERLMRLARLLVLVFMLFCLLIFIAGIYYFPSFAANYPEEFGIYDWTPTQMDAVFGRIGLSLHAWIQWKLVSAIAFAIFVCGLGFFLFFRKRDDWFSTYTAAAFVLFGTASGSPASALAGMNPAWDPILTPLQVFAWVGVFLIFFLFPDGRIVPRWGGWMVILFILSFLIDIIVYQGGTPPAALFAIMFIPLAFGPLSQIYRYHKVSDAVQRQQTKWVVLALLVVFGYIMIGASGLFFPALTDSNSSAGVVFAITSSSTNLIMGLIPLSIAIAILRYRLWDVDVLIRRTLVYGLLTAALALVFFGGVALLQGAFGALTGTVNSPVAIVLSTLAIAALFNTLRRRVQDFIDRRFYRKKYNAEQALARFAATARSQTDIEELSAELQAVVQETMQPEGVSLWLKPKNKRVRHES